MGDIDSPLPSLPANSGDSTSLTNSEFEQLQQRKRDLAAYVLRSFGEAQQGAGSTEGPSE